MLSNRAAGILVASAIAVVLMVSSGLFYPGVGTSESSATHGAPSVSAVSAQPSLSARPTISESGRSILVQRYESLERGGRFVGAAGLEPNLGYSTVREGRTLVPANIASGQVSPGPTSIGVNDLGLRVNSTGALVPYAYRTTSIDGTVTISNLSFLPVMTNASEGITVQLNAVENNVTVFGQSVDQIWAQNVIFYSVTGHQLQLLTDAWNFTGPPFALFQNDIYENSPGGFLFGGTYVHQVPLSPPSFVVQMPFTIRLYLNATNVAGRNALYFNYTLSSTHDIYLGGADLGKAINDGSFDWIIFNSTAGQPKHYKAPPASFLIDGGQATNLGLPNDAEIAICGPSDGFSADLRAISATAQLLYLNGSLGAYAPVPAAFTTTEDTGESVEGVDAHFTAASARLGEAFLTAGPEFVYGLWNATGPGVHERPFQVDLSPASALLWASPDLGGPHAGFSDTTAAWALGASSDLSFWLPVGPGQHYSALALANDFDPVYLHLAPGSVQTISLAADPSQGVYAPVLAFGNAGVASIARSGDGSPAHPYVVAYQQSQPISALFGTFDIFSEPIYPGLLFQGVTAHVVVVDPPQFRIHYSALDLFPLTAIWGLNPPRTNDLPIEVYDSSNVSIVGAKDISGWFPVTVTGLLQASLFLSNDTHTLVAYDRFSSMGSAMIIDDPYGNVSVEENTVFGDHFVVDPIVHSPNGSSLSRVLVFNTTYSGGPKVGGLGVFASGNTIYNNWFETPIGAYSPPQNTLLSYMYVNDLGYQDFGAVASVYSNAWNISAAPSFSVRFVNGIPLFGSVVGAAFVGGNAWAGWNGSVPFTDKGLIVGGADFLPIPLAGSKVFAVAFAEFGLPKGTKWSFTLGGSSYSSNASMLVVYELPGTYSWSVLGVAGLTPHPSSGHLHVHGNRVQWILFA